MTPTYHSRYSAVDGGGKDKLFMGEQGHAKYLNIGERSKESKKHKKQNLFLEMIYGPLDEDWPPEVNM